MVTPLDVARIKARAAQEPPVRRAPTISYHAHQQAEAKGFTDMQVLKVALDPTLTYPSGKAGQERRCRGDICAVIDIAKNQVITVYSNIIETPRRPDQEAQ